MDASGFDFQPLMHYALKNGTVACGLTEQVAANPALRHYPVGMSTTSWENVTCRECLDLRTAYESTSAPLDHLVRRMRDRLTRRGRRP